MCLYWYDEQNVLVLKLMIKPFNYVGVNNHTGHAVSSFH